MVEITDPFYTSPHQFYTGLLATGAGVGGEVIQIGDRWYMPDHASGRYKMISIPALRPQEDIADRPGEQSLSNAGLWRRTPSSWHHGAGQRWYDRDEADPFRYRWSRGVDVWTKWQMSLLPGVSTVATESGGSWTSLAVGEFTGGSRLVAAGTSGRCVTIESDGTVNEVTGLTGEVWCASTGSTVYVADSAGIHSLDSAGTGISSFNSNLTGGKLWFAKDRLWFADGADLWDVIDASTGGSGTNPVHSHTWPDWEWSAVHESLGQVYAAGFAGEKGQVYSIGIDPDTTDPLTPIVALPLPTTEIPHSVYGYVGFVLVGTNRGLRVCQAQDDGTLISGPIVGFDLHEDHLHPVRCIEGVDRFVWFGQDDLYDDASSMGRVDLSTFVETLGPAYAPDLTADQLGNLTAARYFDMRMWFAVGDTLYVESDSRVSDGYLDTGRITMNIADRKAGVYVDLRHDPLESGDSVNVYVTAPNRDMSLVGSSNVAGSERPINAFPINPGRQIWHDLRVELDRSPGGESPVVTGVSLAAQVAPDRSLTLLLPLLVHETVQYVDRDFQLDVLGEIAYFVDLVFAQRLVRFQQGSLTFQGFVEDFEFVPHQSTQDGRGLNGTVVLQFKTAESRR